MKIYRSGLILRLALLLAANRDARNAPKVVIRIFAGSVYEKILLFVDKILPVVFSHFKIWSKLNGVRGTRLFTETAKDAA